MNWIFLKKLILNNPMNWILSWNEWLNHILNRYLPFLTKSHLFCLFWTLLGNCWALFLFNQYQWFPDYWIELSFELNQQNFFELNNILNWILGNAILNKILNEIFFGKIQRLNWIDITSDWILFKAILNRILN